MFDGFINQSIIKKAIASKKIDLEIIDFRIYANNKLKQVDDYQYGGGGGMVIGIEPITKAIKAVKTKNSKVYLLSPQGIPYNQKIASNLAKSVKHLILICGHYEGFDERIIHYIDGMISIGDYILTNGEIPAMIVIDSISRLVNNVIKNQSLDCESFDNNLLDYPVYTKPLEFEGHKVPEVLLSGNHQKIKAFRLAEQIKKTKLNRPDLYKQYLKELKGEQNGKK